MPAKLIYEGMKNYGFFWHDENGVAHRDYVRVSDEGERAILHVVYVGSPSYKRPDTYRKPAP